MVTVKKAMVKDYSMLIIPILLMVWLISLPVVMSIPYEIMADYVVRALELPDKGKLILASLILVLIYTASEIFIFLAAFSLGQKVHYHYGKWASVWAIGLTIVGSYAILTVTLDYTWSLAAPLLIMLGYRLALYKINITSIKFRYQAFILLQLMITIQWFEVTPFFQNYGFGKSKTVETVIEAAYQLQADHILQFINILISIPFLVSSFVTIVLVQINMLRLKELALSKRREQELEEMKIGVIESRSSEEMHSLVHDLKTPLTTIQGLISLVEMQTTKYDSTVKVHEYTSRIDNSIKQLNEMISEILYEDVKREIALQDLINYTRAHLVEEHLSQNISFSIDNPDALIRINRIRLVRVLINLIQNAAEATNRQKDGK